MITTERFVVDENFFLEKRVTYVHNTSGIEGVINGISSRGKAFCFLVVWDNGTFGNYSDGLQFIDEDWKKSKEGVPKENLE
tara:strand:+ start:674 stop:916 length:243 start_codon:yes stop_codon:yes gene_type:complete